MVASKKTKEAQEYEKEVIEAVVISTRADLCSSETTRVEKGSRELLVRQDAVVLVNRGILKSQEIPAPPNSGY